MSCVSVLAKLFRTEGNCREMHSTLNLELSRIWGYKLPHSFWEVALLVQSQEMVGWLIALKQPLLLMAVTLGLVMEMFIASREQSKSLSYHGRKVTPKKGQKFGNDKY